MVSRIGGTSGMAFLLVWFTVGLPPVRAPFVWSLRLVGWSGGRSRSLVSDELHLDNGQEVLDRPVKGKTCGKVV